MRIHFPKLTPLQSRFAASLLASLLLLIIYLFVSHPHFAYATASESIHNEDHNHHRLAQDSLLFEGNSEGVDSAEDDQAVDYESSFIGVHRDIIGRAEDGVNTLFNNQSQLKSISASVVDHYVFTFNTTSSGNTRPLREAREAHNELDSRVAEPVLKRQAQSSQAVNITINVCFQPTINSSTDQPTPPLTMYISTLRSNTRPGPGAGTPVPVIEGYARFQVPLSGDVFIGVSAPSLPPGFTGTWNYEIAGTTDPTPFHTYKDSAEVGNYPAPIFLADSDASSALLVTRGLENILNSTRHDLIIFPTRSSQLNGLSRSYCALNLFRNSSDSVSLSRNVTTRYSNDNHIFKEQYFLEGLNSNTNYSAVLVLSRNQSSVFTGGGGTVYPVRSFTTKSMDNCQLIFNLDFCADTAYSVPANPAKINRSALGDWYDQNAANLYREFNYSLQQIPCNTSDSAKYSLVRNCTDCATEYKNWLCAVTIPRCADFNTPNSIDYWYQKPRNMAATYANGSSPILDDMDIFDGYLPEVKPQKLELLKRDGVLPRYLGSSRFPAIDEVIQPGPYKEILPCIDFCHHLVQSCPAALGFGCPKEIRNHPLQSRSYGQIPPSEGVNGEPTCNYRGALYSDPRIGAASTRSKGTGLLFFSATVVTLLLTL